VADNVKRLCEIPDSTKFRSTCPAPKRLLQAVRLARYHTRRSHLVRFAGAYHGWWGDVQPAWVTRFAARDLYARRYVRADAPCAPNRRDIACVLVNPCRRFTPTPMRRRFRVGRQLAKRQFRSRRYGAWLKALREVCSERGIVLIFDEVFVGFRLAAGGAQEYFGVRADMVTYGKSLAGGLPVGVVCGRKELMRRFRDDRPADVCFARGTFNSHPYVMTAMDEFLSRLASPNFYAVYNGLDETWNGRAKQLNERLAAQNLPVGVSNLSSIWMVHYTEPSRYN